MQTNLLTKIVLFLIFFVTFSPKVLFAADFKIARTTEGILQFYGPSCSVLNEEAKLILQWKVRVEGSNNEVIPSCTYDEKINAYFIILNNLVPDFVAKHHGSGAVRGSSNCFNTALVMSGFTSAFRYSDLGEIEFYLNSPLCRKVLSSEKPHPGDLIMIKPTNPDGLEYHAAVYVSEHLIFEKRNAAPIEPFQLNLLDQMLKEREVTPGCDRVDEINIKNCKIFSQYYRCKSTKEILEEGLLKKQKRYLELDSEVCVWEMQITNSTLCKDSPPAAELGAQISKSLTVLYSLVEQEMKDQFQEFDNKAQQTNPDVFLWGMLLSRIFLIQDELKPSVSDH